MDHYASLAVSAFIISVALTPVCRIAGNRLGALDQPGGRRVNSEAVPRTGGLAMFVAVVAVLLAVLPAGQGKTGIILGACGAFLLGFADDLRSLPPAVKLTGQVAVSLIPVFFGVTIRCLTDPRGGFFLIGAWGIPLTVIWLVATMNMINLLDGLDGLAAGVTAIAGGALFFVALGKGQTLAAILCCVLVGSTLGFLVFNFNPARVFMGDGGALLLGFMLGAISVQGALKSATAVALVVPLLALGVPFFDTLMAVCRRLMARRHVFSADREHLHHRLLALGLSQRQTVLLLYLISGLLGGLAIFTALTGLRVGAVFFLAFLGSGLYGGYKTGIITPIRRQP